MTNLAISEGFTSFFQPDEYWPSSTPILRSQPSPQLVVVRGPSFDQSVKEIGAGLGPKAFCKQFLHFFSGKT